MTSVDLIWPHAWISTPNKEKLSDASFYIELLKNKSDEIKHTSPLFSESELFEYFPIGLELRSHDLQVRADLRSGI